MVELFVMEADGVFGLTYIWDIHSTRLSGRVEVGSAALADTVPSRPESRALFA